MRFDDRLTTVLAQPAGDAHDRAVRWRQLVELIARSGSEPGSPAAEAAMAVVRDDSHALDEAVRAAAARAIAGLRLPVALIAVFAADTLAVAAPILASARLEPEAWARVQQSASPDVARFIASLHPELTAPEAVDDAQPEPKPPVVEAPPAIAAAPAEERPQDAAPSISELVARIERLRRTREAGSRRAQSASAGDAIDGSALFRWESTASGEIAWVDGVPRGALIGRSLASAGDEGLDPRVERAFALRAPFRDAPLLLSRDGRLAGEWRISGMPAFRPSDGRFAGYRGVGVRAGTDPAGPPAPAPRFDPPDHAALRELVHEIKTPLNAILGFAEIIERQYLGPADRRYRTRAGDITRQARSLLGAIDDLDLAARLQSAGTGGGPVALGDLYRTLGDELAERAAAHGARIAIAVSGNEQSRLPAELAERLIRRFLGALVDALQPGEVLSATSGMAGGRCLLSVDRSKLLAAKGAEQLLVAAPSADGGVAESLAFSLRLVRGLVKIVGGDLEAAGQMLTLTLPA